MRAYIKKESGFTLIEALVAFLIIIVGLAGAALFQSKLITESGASKSRAVAITLAEKELEERRALLTDAQYAGLDTIAAGGVPVVHSVTVGNAVYDVSFSASVVSGAAEAHYLLTASVDWDDAKGVADSVSLSTLLSENQPENSLDNREQAGSTGSNPNVGQIERPSGAAVAIARVTTEEAKTDTAIGEYIALGDDKFGIKVAECDDGTCDVVVSVIKRINSDSPIFKITGNIYFHDDPDNTFETVEAAPNVLTSEGGGCAVYAVDSQAAYSCLFGEGWYGTISLVLPIESNGKPADTVCLSPRGYKYYRVDPDTVVGSIDADDIIGQSGLVRFTTDFGDGPYLATSDAAPGLAYYYLSDQVNTDTKLLAVPAINDPANNSGNIENQHFVVTDDTGNDSDDKYSICIQDGGADAEPLFSHADSDVPASYPDLTQDNYSYTYVSGASITVEIPDDEIVIGYVNKAYEISGSVDVTGVTGTAEDLKDKLVVGMSPLPDYAQECVLEVIGDQIFDYSCFVDYNWEGTVSMSVASGAALTVSFAPSEFEFSDSGTYPRVTADVTGKDFTVTE